MPIDTLGADAQSILTNANDFLRSNRSDESLRQFHLKELNGIERRLESDIKDRSRRRGQNH